MIITINGRPGAGKSTVAHALAKRLGYDILDVGQLRRKEAKRRGMTLGEFNVWSEKHPKAGDWAFEQIFIRAAHRKPNMIVTGRVAFHFLPESFKVFLNVSAREGARRALQDQHERVGEVGRQPTIATIMRLHRERIASDTRRYEKLYGINIFLRKNYDFFLNTTDIPIPSMVKAVTKAFHEWKKVRK